MQTTQGDLVLIGAHTPTPKAFWKGQPVEQVTGLRVVNGVVTLTAPEDPVLAEMQAAGIKIVRGNHESIPFGHPGRLDAARLAVHHQQCAEHVRPAVASMIQSGVLSDIEAGLKEAGIVAQEASLVDAKLIDDTYFMVKLG